MAFNAKGGIIKIAVFRLLGVLLGVFRLLGVLLFLRFRILLFYALLHGVPRLAIPIVTRICGQRCSERIGAQL